MPPPPEKEPATEEEIARKAAIREKQGQRLREMAAAKRSTKIADLETEVIGLEQLLQNLEDAGDEDIDALLAESGYLSREEIQGALAKATVSLRKLKGEAVLPEPEKVDDSTEKDKYPLLDVPNSLLTVDQVCRWSGRPNYADFYGYLGCTKTHGSSRCEVYNDTAGLVTYIMLYVRTSEVL